MGSLGPESASESTAAQFRPLNAEEFRAQAHRMVDFIADYYKKIEGYPVLSQVEPGYLRSALPKTAPYDGEPLEDILSDITRHIIPGMTHWLSPNFFAFFPATVSTAAFLGEMASTSFNCVGFNWLASPAATELEMVVMDWMAAMLKLPKSFMFSGSGGGVIQGTTSEAVLCTLIAARDRALSEIGGANISKLVVYGSDQTHSTFTKASKLAGILPENIRLIRTSKSTQFALSPSLLRRAIQSDLDSGLLPLYLCATVGTTSTTAVDPIAHLADVAQEYGVWVHVDAAYAGSACICPEFRHYLNGVDIVDSLSIGAHKWLLSYLDCVCLWVKNPGLMVKALNTNPEYLKNKLTDSNTVVDYKDWQIGTGRKFKALKLWIILRSYGLNKLQTHIRSDVRMAAMFQELINMDARFEILVPTKFALVCFRMNPYPRGRPDPTKNIEALNRKLLDWVNSTGHIYITHTIVAGVYMLRFAVGATLTEDRHVLAAWDIIKEGANRLLLEIHAAALLPPPPAADGNKL